MLAGRVSVEWRRKKESDVAFSQNMETGYKGDKINRRYKVLFQIMARSQPAITCSKLTIETLGQGVKYVQS